MKLCGWIIRHEALTAAEEIRQGQALQALQLGLGRILQGE